MSVPVTTVDSPQPLAALAGVLLVFMRFSMLPEIQTMLMGGFNLYLLYFAAIPASFAVLIAGGLKRAFRGGPAYYWLGYMLWIVIGTPFSTWRGDSAHIVNDFLRANLPMLFVIAGLAVNWRICTWMMNAIVGGAFVTLLASRVFMQESGGRFGLSLGTLGNPNDFAAHLLLVTPFLLWFATGRRMILFRLAAFAGMGISLYLVLATGSRGALIALCVDVLFILWKGSMKLRISTLAITPIAAVALLIVMPQSIVTRLGSFSASNSSASEEALDSTESRKYLLGKAVEYTLRFPIFGLGAGQFANYEGGHNAVVGTHGSFHETHNAYMQAASECGIPALIFMIAGIFSTLSLFAKVLSEAGRRRDCEDIRAAAFYTMLGFVGFLVAIFFLNFAYLFYLPAMGGLAVAMKAAADQEFRNRQNQNPAPTFAPLYNAARFSAVNGAAHIGRF